LRKNGKRDEYFPLRSAHKSGVQGTKSLAGVRGDPEKLFLPLLPPKAAIEVKSNPPLLTSVLIINIMKTFLMRM